MQGPKLSTPIEPSIWETDWSAPMERIGDSVGFLIATFGWISVLLTPVFAIVLRAL